MSKVEENEKNVVDMTAILEKINHLEEQLKLKDDEIKKINEEKSLSKEEVLGMLEKSKADFKLSQKELIEMDKEEAFKTAEKLKKDMVEITIPVDQLNPKDTTVVVQINGYKWIMKRGAEIEVPRAVKNILKDGGYL